MIRLTKKDGYTKTTYIFLNQVSGNRRVYKKDERFYIVSSEKVIDVTDMRNCFYNEY